jgi:hypothetical protein
MANKYIAFSLFIMAVHLYINHKQANYTGDYNNKGNYEYISPMKHDIFKQITISLFILSNFLNISFDFKDEPFTKNVSRNLNNNWKVNFI